MGVSGVLLELETVLQPPAVSEPSENAPERPASPPVQPGQHCLRSQCQRRPGTDIESSAGTVHPIAIDPPLDRLHGLPAGLFLAEHAKTLVTGIAGKGRVPVHRPRVRPAGVVSPGPAECQDKECGLADRVLQRVSLALWRTPGGSSRVCSGPDVEWQSALGRVSLGHHRQGQ